MNDIGIALVCTIVGAVCTIIGTAIGFKTFKETNEKNLKTELKEDTEKDTQVGMRLNYISNGIDDIKLEIKDQNRKISSIIERVAKVEESAKSAHKRLDAIEKEEN